MFFDFGLLLSEKVNSLIGMHWLSEPILYPSLHSKQLEVFLHFKQWDEHSLHIAIDS